MVTAMCREQLKDKNIANDMMLIMSLIETINQLAM